MNCLQVANAAVTHPTFLLVDSARVRSRYGLFACLQQILRVHTVPMGFIGTV